jgi:TrpR family trp operon transcriptional repressor
MNSGDPRVEETIGELARLFAHSGDPALIASFLRCLLTPAETADIAARWTLVKALDSGVSQRDIAKSLGVSLCKITRGSRELKKPGSAFRRMLDLMNLSETGGAALY